MFFLVKFFCNLELFDFFCFQYVPNGSSTWSSSLQCVPQNVPYSTSFCPICFAQACCLETYIGGEILEWILLYWEVSKVSKVLWWANWIHKMILNLEGTHLAWALGCFKLLVAIHWWKNWIDFVEIKFHLNDIL